MGTTTTKPPKTLSSRAILDLTYYDNMGNKERDLVFTAYKFNTNKRLYELRDPSILPNSTIIKLNSGEIQQ